jgi:hypothetical protein
MPARLRHTAALACAAAALAASAWAAAPLSTDGTDPKTWDPKMDGTIAAPGNHQVIFENDAVRIDTVMVWRRAAEPYHMHPHYSVLVIDTPYGTGLDRDITGAKAPTVMIDSIAPPVVNIQPAQALHSIRNDGDVNGHLIRVEFKTDVVPTKVERPWAPGAMPKSSDGTDPASWPEALDAQREAGAFEKIMWQSDKIRVLSITVPAGAEEPYHHDAYPAVVIVDTPASGEDRARSGQSVTFRSGKARVYLEPPKAMHAIRNTDTKPLHITRIEFLKGFPPGA